MRHRALPLSNLSPAPLPLALCPSLGLPSSSLSPRGLRSAVAFDENALPIAPPGRLPPEVQVSAHRAPPLGAHLHTNPVSPIVLQAHHSPIFPSMLLLGLKS